LYYALFARNFEREREANLILVLSKVLAQKVFENLDFCAYNIVGKSGMLQ
jgi:hypothetical protein